MGGDHPCACRNNVRPPATRDPRVGSPLRMQEQLLGHSSPSTTLGITPAHAGTTTLNNYIDFINRDHPCACRNNLKLLISLREIMGSPLRMQEQRVYNLIKKFIIRITPAHAGTTLLSYFFQLSFGDHPCACRNNLVMDNMIIVATGSPLRMQEQPKAFPNLSSKTGITPAHAGTTKAYAVCRKNAQDHPCACRNN